MKHIAVIIEKLGTDNYRKIKEIKYKEKDNSVTFKEHEYPLPKNPVYTLVTDKETFLFYEITQDSVLAFKMIDLGIDTKMLWRLIRQNLLGSLVAKIRNDMSEQPQKWKIMTTIVIFAIGCLLGYVIGNGGLKF